jgi:hypothetical protein
MKVNWRKWRGPGLVPLETVSCASFAAEASWIQSQPAKPADMRGTIGPPDTPSADRIPSTIVDDNLQPNDLNFAP